MSEEEIIKRLKELKEEGAILGEDEVKTILNLIEKQDKMIDYMVNTIVSDKKILPLICERIINKTEDECKEQNFLCDDCIKEYFRRKVENES